MQDTQASHLKQSRDLVKHTNLLVEIEGKSATEQKKRISSYHAAFDAARPNTAESVADYREYLAAADFNIFVAKSASAHRAAVHARTVQTPSGRVGTIEQIWHGQDSGDHLHAIRCAVSALNWLKSRGCESFIVERVNSHMLADSPEVEGKRYSPGDAADPETILEAQLETRSLQQESTVLEALDSQHNLTIARIDLPYFQPDVWENGFSHGYFSLWIGNCTPSQAPQNITREFIDSYLESLYPDEAGADSFTRRVIQAAFPLSSGRIDLIPISASSDQSKFDQILQKIRVDFLNGEIDSLNFEKLVLRECRVIANNPPSTTQPG